MKSRTLRKRTTQKRAAKAKKAHKKAKRVYKKTSDTYKKAKKVHKTAKKVHKTLKGDLRTGADRKVSMRSTKKPVSAYTAKDIQKIYYGSTKPNAASKNLKEAVSYHKKHKDAVHKMINRSVEVLGVLGVGALAASTFGLGELGAGVLGEAYSITAGTAETAEALTAAETPSALIQTAPTQLDLFSPAFVEVDGGANMVRGTAEFQLPETRNPMSFRPSPIVTRTTRSADRFMRNVTPISSRARGMGFRFG